MNEIENLAIKDDFLNRSYYLILEETKKDLFSGRIIRFPVVYMLLCRSLQIDKGSVNILLKEMAKRNMITIHSFNGISIKDFRRCSNY